MSTRPAFAKTNHRPWPLPSRPWIWRQRWSDLLFAHWPVPAAQLQPLVPESLQIQEFEGTSWAGVVPFMMEDVMVRDFPALPGISRFPEINLRLYVERDGKPGVWFLSLDATNPLAVIIARKAFYLPYFWSAIHCETTVDEFSYTSRRRQGAKLEFEATYRPRGEVFAAKPGSLEYWLTERYCLYAESPGGQIYRGDVQHPPWPLQLAEAEILVNQLPRPHHLDLAGAPPLLHFSRHIDVAMWSLTPLPTP